MIRELEVQRVQDSWRKVVPIADTAADLFYGRLFELDPLLRDMFPEDMKGQKKKLVAMLGAAVAGLSNINDLLPVVKDLGKRHAGYGVKESHYKTVGAALIWTLEQGLGNAWSPALKDAWVEVYTALSGAMVEASSYRRAA